MCKRVSRASRHDFTASEVFVKEHQHLRFWEKHRTLEGNIAIKLEAIDKDKREKSTRSRALKTASPARCHIKRKHELRDGITWFEEMNPSRARERPGVSSDGEWGNGVSVRCAALQKKWYLNRVVNLQPVMRSKRREITSAGAGKQTNLWRLIHTLMNQVKWLLNSRDESNEWNEQSIDQQIDKYKYYNYVK